MPQAKKPQDERGVLTITRERLQDTLDDAVRRGRMTRDDASDLLAEILRRAVSAPGRHGPACDRHRRRRLPDRRLRRPHGGPGRHRSSASSTPPELRKVRDYERRNANRKTVLAAVDTKLP